MSALSPDTVIDTLVDAFMSLGVLVAGVMLLVGGLRMAWGDRMERALAGSRRAGPLIGALLSVPPGCVGVLTAVRLYGKRQVSYGTAIAALTATMGDSAWLLLAANPMLTLKLKLLLTVLGGALGFAIDAFGIDPAKDSACSAGSGPAAASCGGRHGGASSCHASRSATPRGGKFASFILRLAGHGDHKAGPLPWSRPQPALSAAAVAEPDNGVIVTLFWCLAVLGLVLSLPVTFQLLEPSQLARMFGEVDLYNLVGIAGFAASCVVFLKSRNKLCCEETASGGKPSLREVLDATSKEVAFVTVWSGLAFLTWETVAAVWHIDPQTMKFAGAVGVLIGALGGLVPACGVEILFASLFVSGMIPLSALLAYLVSEDGSGFIPLAALRPRSAVLATVITTVPALAVGFGALLLGF